MAAIDLPLALSQFRENISISGIDMVEKLEALKVIAEAAQLQISWALGLFAGSVALIIGTSHHRPENRTIRLFYLIMIPAWALIGFSIYFGDLIYRNYIAALFAPENSLGVIFGEMNGDYAVQQKTMQFAIIFLSIWLVIYLFWWVFLKEEAGGKP